MFKLEIETGNEAFAENAGAELTRILAGLAGSIRAYTRHVRPGYSDTGPLFDVNGNRVGSWYYEAPE